MSSSSQAEHLLSYIDKIIPLFQRNVSLENITRPKIDEYDELISGYHDLTIALQKIKKSLEKEDAGKPKEVLNDMVNAMLNCTIAAEAYWTKLKGKALGTHKYGFFENSRDMSNLRRLIQVRKDAGKELNYLRNVLEAQAGLS